MRTEITLVQLYYSELKDLFRNYLDDYYTLKLVKNNKDKLTYFQGAKRVDITDHLLSDNMTSLMKLINRGLANRKTRDNATNDVSSRSILLLNVYVTWEYYNSDGSLWRSEKKKFTIVDLAGQERAARLDINDKRYREALFINESLDCLMGTTRKVSVGKTPDFTIHPVMLSISDTFGGNWQKNSAQIFVCMSPSNFDK